jgi:uncharacterized protein RhaS with RHS repeats
MIARVLLVLFFLSMNVAIAEKASAYYDPRVGRFLSPDPIDYGPTYTNDVRPSPEKFNIPGGQFLRRDSNNYKLEDVNLYRYVGNGPTNNTDPTGLQYSPECMLARCDPPALDASHDPGFKICKREIQGGGKGDNFVAGFANACGGEHTYLQYGPVDENGDPIQGTDGWGIGGGSAGTLPLNEQHFKPNFCNRLSKCGDCIKYGKGAGKSGSSATDDEIKDCITNTPMSKPYKALGYNCQAWAEEAAASCGLCKSPKHITRTNP